MPCSAVTLSISTICTIAAAILLTLAFLTDNWLYYEVRRSSIQQSATESSDQEILKNFNTKYYYFTRTRGLLRICFPKERPPVTTVPTYLSPLETHCTNIEFFPEENFERPSFDDTNTRLNLSRSSIGLYLLSFALIFCAFFTGLSGCWKRSPGAITATSILLLCASVMVASSIGLWHTMEFYEKEKIVGEDFLQQWNPLLKENTKISYDWSYNVAWTGVLFCLLAAILFSGSAVCLRNEREKEEQLNLQFLMPALSHKQAPYPQYCGYTPPHPLTGSYNLGSQYGQYNY